MSLSMNDCVSCGVEVLELAADTVLEDSNDEYGDTLGVAVR
jgi:hypothetical protein